MISLILKVILGPLLTIAEKYLDNQKDLNKLKHVTKRVARRRILADIRPIHHKTIEVISRCGTEGERRVRSVVDKSRIGRRDRAVDRTGCDLELINREVCVKKMIRGDI